MEYTAHVQVPDAAVGAVLHDLLLGQESVTCATLRSGNGTWLSYGFHSDSDDDASLIATSLRYRVSKLPGVTMPQGYEADSLQAFETTPMIVTCGRVVVHSEGI